MKLNRWFFTIHSITGLATGLLLLLLGISGSILVFMPEIDHYANRERLAITAAPHQQRLPLDSLYRIITSRHTQLEGIAWTNPGEKDLAAEFRLYGNDGNVHTYDLGLTSINPYTGRVIREGSYRELATGLVYWIYQFHFCFQWGMPGILLTALMGIAMLVSCMTGIIIYRKHCWQVFTFRVKLSRKNWRTFSSGLHRIVGVWSLLPNMILFFTGFWMNLFGFDAATWQRKQVAAPAPQVLHQSLDVLYARSLQAIPGLHPVSVYLPVQPGKPFRVSGSLPGQPRIFAKAGNTVTTDVMTGRIKNISRLEERSWGQLLEGMVHPLHTGNYGDTLIKLLYVFFGLLPGLLSITGGLLWYRKLHSRSKRGHKQVVAL
ncbi:PepSY domain-containing protein [Chitinophaga pendula]|uniref:PepSY-associated TM helix domain-containing protein n=1 Tax=Chitinophaga TaxID=79328 RepID=UPI000BAF4BE6|nr:MULTISPECIES: PepSY-associated TM helix domain-containing protein [Chitinophaga]ASZ13808.1 hypothetical protein CK934_24055 [Chitinophaga sp. MD30]UCJ08572.1 PepSY domain-containing protein [Chitinophaga pendula]